VIYLIKSPLDEASIPINDLVSMNVRPLVNDIFKIDLATKHVKFSFNSDVINDFEKLLDLLDSLDKNITKVYTITDLEKMYSSFEWDG